MNMKLSDKFRSLGNVTKLPIKFCRIQSFYLLNKIAFFVKNLIKGQVIL